MKNFLSFSYLITIFIVIIFFINSSCVRRDKGLQEDSETIVSPTINTKSFIQIDSTYNLIKFKPNYSNIDLICINRPSHDNDSIIMMIGAAFTREKLKSFDHSNICGSHTSKGIYYERPYMERLTGTFAYSNGKPQFYYKEDSEKILKNIAMQGGSGFMQDLIIHADSIVPQTRPLTDTAQFRALCLLNNELVIVESNRIMEYNLFIKALDSLGVSEAIYMDIGPGWNYSWYRDNEGKVIELHPGPYEYSSNWLIFYK